MCGLRDGGRCGGGDHATEMLLAELELKLALPVGPQKIPHRKQSRHGSGYLRRPRGVVEPERRREIATEPDLGGGGEPDHVSTALPAVLTPASSIPAVRNHVGPARR
jgi:hypothetical protein